MVGQFERLEGFEGLEGFEKDEKGEASPRRELIFMDFPGVVLLGYIYFHN
jgi:hypothetical protein